MKRSAVFVVLLALVVTLGVAGTGFSGHKEEKGLVKGTITEIVPVEYEITIKDDHGKETKARVKDVGDVKVGDNVTIQGGKAKKAIKPKTGGY
jgi:hypothetical protein